MRVASKLIILLLLHFCHSAIAQSARHTLLFQPVYNNLPVNFNNTYFRLSTGDSIRFDLLKFYISSVELLNKNVSVWKEEKSYHLINATDKSRLQLVLDLPAGLSYDTLRFYLGIDSLTSMNGISGGDLDPVNGMYWTWQNGYINLKLEGTSNLFNARKHEFHFHLGGYRYPYNCIKEVNLAVAPGRLTEIFMDLEKIVDVKDLTSGLDIMEPSDAAVVLSGKVARSFSTR
jgi:hypothetical protein